MAVIGQTNSKVLYKKTPRIWVASPALPSNGWLYGLLGHWCPGSDIGGGLAGWRMAAAVRGGEAEAKYSRFYRRRFGQDLET